jgi:hypothetical protein
MFSFQFNAADTTDGILRKADMPLIAPKVCQDFLVSNNAGVDQDLSQGFLCAGGSGEEESCFVSILFCSFLFFGLLFLFVWPTHKSPQTTLTSSSLT